MPISPGRGGSEADLYIGVDDTDGPDGMCTTYLMTRIVEENTDLLAGYPRLVRLNPNVPFRTRGNGALSIKAGTGRHKLTVGYVGDREIRTSAFEHDVDVPEGSANEMWNLVQELSAKSENTNPGLVIGNPDAHGKFYSRAVTRILPLKESISYVRKQSVDVRMHGSGRGIIGAFASISWPSEHSTYEVIAYSFPHAFKISKSDMLEIASYAESFDFTFNSMDYRNAHASIFPNPRTPVIYGIRGTDPDKLLQLASDINERFSLEAERFFVFRSNQGTDDHIMQYTGKLTEMCSYRIRGRVSKYPRAIRGGHYFSEIISNGKNIGIAAFEPTKEFRTVFSSLIPGDDVEIYGSYLGGILNTEKLKVHSLASSFSRMVPYCPECGKLMRTEGAFSFECRKCGNTSHIPRYIRNKRTIKPDFYEVPVCARRHLSSPVEFLNMGAW